MFAGSYGQISRVPITATSTTTTAITTTTTTSKMTTTIATAVCKSWCANNAKQWTMKCTWTDCAACPQCSDPTPSTVSTSANSECKQWCDSHSQTWLVKCTWSQRCGGYSECSVVFLQQVAAQTQSLSGNPEINST